MDLIHKYLCYIRDQRRYSIRTVQNYEHALKTYLAYASDGCDGILDSEVLSFLNPSQIRSYMVDLMDDPDKKRSPRTVSLHLSALSGFCRYLIKEGMMKTNPVSLVPKPKMEKRLPSFFRKDAMDEYFKRTEMRDCQFLLEYMAQVNEPGKRSEVYGDCLARLIISILYNLGIRRAELISMDISDVDFARQVVKITGKGNKMREIPILGALCEEILLYLKAVELMEGRVRSLKEPLLVTFSGKRLYPMYVDRAVKKELSAEDGAVGRKSPHVLRHSLATELLDGGTDLNSIKELLGHSSLAATQVYTHNSVAKLKSIYKSAHPRAKNGGKHGD